MPSARSPSPVPNPEATGEEPPLPEAPPNFEEAAAAPRNDKPDAEPASPRTPPRASSVAAAEAPEQPPGGGPKPATDALGWSDLAPRLELDSMARQVALNSIVASHGDGRLKLALLPEMEVLIKPEIRDNIRRAIEAELGVSLQLEFVTGESLPCETPAQAAARRAELQRLRALEEIRRDPLVRELQQYFGAELDETSLRRVEEND